jgi:2-polyprenyl-3-methyl-5-hydroxy-6-metoxy-1,4-benzoquinol methylase
MSDPESSLEDLARYWDDNAAAWAREVRRGHDVAREFLNNPAFLALIGGLRGRQVLDAGCGDGYNTRILARAGAHMTGVDLSARMIGLRRKRSAAPRSGFATRAHRIPRGWRDHAALFLHVLAEKPA